jgi:hypothetical protein
MLIFAFTVIYLVERYNAIISKSKYCLFELLRNPVNLHIFVTDSYNNENCKLFFTIYNELTCRKGTTLKSIQEINAAETVVLVSLPISATS